MTIEENKNNVYQAVKKACDKANRSSDDVNIIAVTKYVSSDVAEELVKTGIKHIAENRVDKFLDKYQALKNYDLTWHLIGTLQRRKVKDVINLVDYFHALDSVKLAEEIQKRADHTINCFLQVNVSGEESKHGFSPEELDTVLKQIENLDNLKKIKVSKENIIFDDEIYNWEEYIIGVTDGVIFVKDLNDNVILAFGNEMEIFCENLLVFLIGKLNKN